MSTSRYECVSEEFLDGLEFLIEDTPDVDLRPTLLAAVRKVRAAKTEDRQCENRFWADTSPIETARRLRLAV